LWYLSSDVVGFSGTNYKKSLG